MAVQSTATHDPLTGTHTPHYLVTEGRKHFAHARRHSGDLSVMALRLDTYELIVLAATKDIADIVVARIAKLVMEKVRAEDSVARVAQATFVVLAAGTAARNGALAERLRRELEEAKVTYATRCSSSSPASALLRFSADPALNAIEDLVRLSQAAVANAQPEAPPPGAAQAGHPGRARARAALLENLATPPAWAMPPSKFAKRLKKISKAIQAGKKV